MRKLVLFATIIIAVVMTQTAAAQSDQQNVLGAAKAIEMNTKSQQAVDQRENALKWLIETKDVHLIVCGDVFSLYNDKKNKNSSSMTLAYTVGMGAFKIANPDKANDENAAQLAGLMLALKAYENGVGDNPKTKHEKVEALLQKRAAGELPALIASFNCGGKK
jgi:hypothetical protein